MPRDPITDYITWTRQRNLSHGLIGRRAAFLRAAEHGIGRPLLTAQPTEITAYLQSERERGLIDATLYVYAGHLRAFYNWAIQHGRTRRNPVLSAATPRRPRYLPRPIADGPLGLALMTADDRARVILMLAALAGLRAVEIARLRREDVLDHMEPPVLVVHGKGDKPRIIALSASLLGELHRYGLPRRGPVIRRADEKQGHVSPSLVSSVANRHLHELGIPDTLHSLRHFAGTALYRQTRDIRLVQETLGHASPAQTAGYAAWAKEDAPGAMEELGRKVARIENGRRVNQLRLPLQNGIDDAAATVE
jgi:site-specific recombinase XerD